eukprot:Hpha_TRINITY_DN16354_c1_g1::TRINITY_DN16354_c1_g1_i2::g.60320::m.60320
MVDARGVSDPADVTLVVLRTRLTALPTLEGASEAVPSALWATPVTSTHARLLGLGHHHLGGAHVLLHGVRVEQRLGGGWLEGVDEGLRLTVAVRHLLDGLHPHSVHLQQCPSNGNVHARHGGGCVGAHPLQEKRLTLSAAVQHNTDILVVGAQAVEADVPPLPRPTLLLLHLCDLLSRAHLGRRGAQHERLHRRRPSRALGDQLGRALLTVNLLGHSTIIRRWRTLICLGGGRRGRVRGRGVGRGQRRVARRGGTRRGTGRGVARRRDRCVRGGRRSVRRGGIRGGGTRFRHCLLVHPWLPW